LKIDGFFQVLRRKTLPRLRHPKNASDMLPGFEYRNGDLHFDGQSVTNLAAQFKTPLYVYSERLIQERYESYVRGAADRRVQICFAVKANSNLSVLRLLGRLGAGADIVSGGELYRCQKAGIPSSKIVFSGVGKTDDEIEAALHAQIMLFSVESAEELHRLSSIAARSGRCAPVSLRMNPDVDAKTHPYISTGLKANKFGIPYTEFDAMLEHAQTLPGIELSGFGYHIGSQLTDVSGFEEAAYRAKELARHFITKVGRLPFLDAGGGLGIRYKGETPPEPEEYVRRILSILDFAETTILFEPGRSIVGSAGVLLTTILFRKENGEKTFYICDAAMNDLIRPALYSAYHEVLPAKEKLMNDPLRRGDLVGPVCETGDFLARDRDLPHFEQSDIAVLATTGAYGFVMASNYNSRPRPAEVMIAGGKPVLIRRRETLDDLIAAELNLF
jgi:diaminopimelate decarboxylase